MDVRLADLRLLFESTDEWVVACTTEGLVVGGRDVEHHEDWFCQGAIADWNLSRAHDFIHVTYNKKIIRLNYNF